MWHASGTLDAGPYRLTWTPEEVTRDANIITALNDRVGEAFMVVPAGPTRILDLADGVTAVRLPVSSADSRP